MQTTIIFILDSIVPAFIIALVVFAIYNALTGKRRQPRYRPDQEVLGQNYRTKNGEYVKCKITGVTTIWQSAIQWEHMYECQVLDADMKLLLNEDRLKPIN